MSRLDVAAALDVDLVLAENWWKKGRRPSLEGQEGKLPLGDQGWQGELLLENKGGEGG